ncbi:MAG: hypothetical protein WD768_21210 [Phycisphaeraceae bacterium]
MPASPSPVQSVEMLDHRQRGATVPRRRQVESILARAEHLPAADAFLLRQVYEHGLRIEDIARQAHWPRTRVYRHIRNLLIRIELPLFSFLITHADLLDKPTRRVACLVVFEGLSQRDAAARLGLSLHQVRQSFARVQALSQL